MRRQRQRPYLRAGIPIRTVLQLHGLGRRSAELLQVRACEQVGEYSWSHLSQRGSQLRIRHEVRPGGPQAAQAKGPGPGTDDLTDCCSHRPQSRQAAQQLSVCLLRNKVGRQTPEMPQDTGTCVRAQCAEGPVGLAADQ